MSIKYFNLINLSIHEYDKKLLHKIRTILNCIKLHHKI